MLMSMTVPTSYEAMLAASLPADNRKTYIRSYLTQKLPTNGPARTFLQILIRWDLKPFQLRQTFIYILPCIIVWQVTQSLSRYDFQTFARWWREWKQSIARPAVHNVTRRGLSQDRHVFFLDGSKAVASMQEGSEHRLNFQLHSIHP